MSEAANFVSSLTISSYRLNFLCIIQTLYSDLCDMYVVFLFIGGVLGIEFHVVI